MATKVFNSPADFNGFFTPFATGATITPNWFTDVYPLWPASHAGDTGDVINTNEPNNIPALAIFGFPTDTGDIPADATLNTIRIQYNWAVSNVPDFATDATSSLDSSIGILSSQVEGITSGSYDEEDTALNVIGSIVVADLYANIFGWVFRLLHTGGFGGTITRRIAISDFVMSVDYTPTGPSPTPVVNAGEDSNALLSEGFDLVGSFTGSGTSQLWTLASGPSEVIFTDATDLETHVSFLTNGKYLLKLSVASADGTGHAFILLTVLDLIALPGPNPVFPS